MCVGGWGGGEPLPASGPGPCASVCFSCCVISSVRFRGCGCVGVGAGRWVDGWGGLTGCRLGATAAAVQAARLHARPTGNLPTRACRCRLLLLPGAAGARIQRPGPGSLFGGGSAEAVHGDHINGAVGLARLQLRPPGARFQANGWNRRQPTHRTGCRTPAPGCRALAACA